MSAAVTGYQTPASANAVDGAVYRYRAESTDLSQWEIGYGAYTVSSTTLARTTILFNSSGGASAINFSAAPQVAVVALAEDLVFPHTPQGRLTLTSATPVMAASATAATTIYYAPFTGAYAPINKGGLLTLQKFTSSATDAVGLTVALGSNWAASSNYDWFIINDAATIRLGSGPDWSAGAVAGSNTEGASSRGTGAGSTELQICNGILTNKNSITIRYGNASTVTIAANEATYVGTTRTGSAGQISFTFGSSASGGGAGSLYVWNAYNQVEIKTIVTDSTSSWTYTSATVRAADNSATMRVSFITGLAQGFIEAKYNQLVRVAAVIGASARIGVALNSTTVLDKQGQSTNNTTTGTADNPAYGANTYAPQLGAHYISANERGDGTNSATFFGAAFQGLTVSLPM